MDLVERANSTFTKKELERLMVYRAAVAAGFYTDQDGSEGPPDTDAAGTDAADAHSSEAHSAEAKAAPAEAGASPERPAH